MIRFCDTVLTDCVNPVSCSGVMMPAEEAESNGNETVRVTVFSPAVRVNVNTTDVASADVLHTMSVTAPDELVLTS